MNKIIRNRWIRPSTRQESSISYKINTEKVTADDVLIVNVFHEANEFKKSFRFSGEDVAAKNSIHFIVSEVENEINLRWTGAQPIEELL